MRLKDINYGEVSTYKDIAQSIHKEKAVRSVASSIGKNPLLVIIPCHRVIGSDGKLRGYRGGIKVKERLLNMEKECR